MSETLIRVAVARGPETLALSLQYPQPLLTAMLGYAAVANHPQSSVARQINFRPLQGSAQGNGCSGGGALLHRVTQGLRPMEVLTSGTLSLFSQQGLREVEGSYRAFPLPWCKRITHHFHVCLILQRVTGTQVTKALENQNMTHEVSRSHCKCMSQAGQEKG